MLMPYKSSLLVWGVLEGEGGREGIFALKRPPCMASTLYMGFKITKGKGVKPSKKNG